MALNPDTFRSEGTNLAQRKLLLTTQLYQQPQIELSCQKVGDGYPFGATAKTYILTPDGVPANLDANDALDYDEASFTDTTPTTQISNTYVLAQTIPIRQYLVGVARAVAAFEIKVSAGTVTLDSVDFGLVKIDENDVVTAFASATATPNASTTNVNYIDVGVQAFISIPYEYVIETHERLGFTIAAKAYVDSSANTGYIKLDTSRGSRDTYCALYIGV